MVSAFLFQLWTLSSCSAIIVEIESRLFCLAEKNRGGWPITVKDSKTRSWQKHFVEQTVKLLLPVFSLLPPHHLYLLGSVWLTEHQEELYQAFTWKVLHPALTQFTPLYSLQTPPCIPWCQYHANHHLPAGMTASACVCLCQRKRVCLNVCEKQVQEHVYCPWGRQY